MIVSTSSSFSSSSSTPLVIPLVTESEAQPQPPQHQQQQAQSRDYYLSSIVWLFIVPALGGFLFGYDIGGTSFVIASLSTLDWDSSSVSLQAAPLKTGWIVSSPAAGALLGTAILLYLDKSKSPSPSPNPSRLRKIPPLGRRQELRYAGLFYCVGAVLEWIAPYSNSSSSGRGTTIPWSWSYLLPFFLLSAGRWVYGLGIGFAMHGGPTYLAETTPASIRGRVVGGKELAIVLGMVAGYTTGALFCRTTLTGRREEEATAPETTNNTNSWSNVYGSTIVLSLLMIVCSYKIPESARWLISQPPAHRRTRNHTTEEENEEEDDDFFVEDTEEQRIAAEVLQALEFVWKPHRVGPEYEALMAIRRQRRNTNTTTSSGGSNHDDDENATEDDAAAATNHGPPPPAHNSIWHKSYRPAVRAGLGLVCLQQITGQPSVLSYATPILAQVPGLSTNSSVVLALFKVLATSLSVALVETRGRKTLLYLGCSLMALALLVLTFVPFENNDNTNENTTYNTTLGQSEGLNVQSYLILFGMFTYIAGYQIGFGPISWLMISEVFPQSIRTSAVAVAVQTNFALNAVVQFLVPTLQQKIGLNHLFGIFGLLSAYSIYFISKYVPETKGLSLEQIEQQFQDQQRQVSTNPITNTTGSGSFCPPNEETTELL